MISFSLNKARYYYSPKFSFSFFVKGRINKLEKAMATKVEKINDKVKTYDR